MSGAPESHSEPRVFPHGNSLIAAEVDLSIYTLEAVFRACYKFTSLCYLFLARTEQPNWLIVTFQAKISGESLAHLPGDFFNELIDQQIREILEAEVGPIRELIVAQAFAEGNLLDPLRDEGNYEEDYLGIGRWR